MEDEKPVRVVATDKGHDGKRVREAGEEFDVNEKVFAPRKRDVFSPTGQKIGEEIYPAPSWFKRVEQRQEQRQEQRDSKHDKGGKALA